MQNQNLLSNIVARTVAYLVLAGGIWALVTFMLNRGILDPTALVLLTAGSFLVQLGGQALSFPLPGKLQELLDSFFADARKTGLWWVEAALTAVAPFFQALVFGLLVLAGQSGLMVLLVEGLGVQVEPAQTITPLLSLAVTIFVLSLLARRYKTGSESFVELKAKWAEVTGGKFSDVHPVAMLAVTSVVRALIIWVLKGWVVGWSDFFFDPLFGVVVLVVIFFAAVIPEQSAAVFRAIKKNVQAARKLPDDAESVPTVKESEDVRDDTNTEAAK